MQDTHIRAVALRLPIDASIELNSALPTRYAIAMQVSIATQQSTSVLQAAGRVGFIKTGVEASLAPPSALGQAPSDALGTPAARRLHSLL
jgi:hypothetical protein